MTVPVHLLLGAALAAALLVALLLWPRLSGSRRDAARERERGDQAEADLRHQRMLFEEFMRHLPGLAFIKDADCRYAYVNESFSTILDEEPGARIGKTIEEIYPGDAAREMTANDRVVLEKGRPLCSVERIPASGDKHHVHLVSKFPILRDGGAVGLGGITVDVTDQIKSETQYRTIFENTGTAVIIIENDTTISLANSEFTALTGVSLEEVEGRMSWAEFFDKEYVDLMLEYHRMRRQDPKLPPKSYETVLVDRRGKRIPVFVTVAIIPDSKRSVASILDISDRKQTEQQLRHQALNDLLTGLPNRTLFLDRLSRTIKLSRREADYQYAVLIIDLDRFKLVNDSLGHDAGDKLLLAFKERLMEVLREVDTVARMGGDEFAVLLEGPGSHEGAIRAAERLKDHMGSPFRLGEHEIFSSASMGVVLSDDRYEQPEQVVRDADTAMYQAKEGGRGNYQVFHVQMHEQAMNLMRVESDLRRAIGREGEFHLVYQPIVKASSGKLAGFEALIRWNHPERGLVPPMDFIPVAEDSGLILPIGDWVLEEALRNAPRLVGGGNHDVPLFLSVNLSVHQLTLPGLTDRIQRLLEKNSLASHHLKLEITETVLMKNAFSVIPMLEGLKRLGVRVAIDDFGTGYSSLSYLHYLPVDTLKVDKAFISELDDSGDRPRIIQTIMGLAQSMDKAVIAEGVETREQYYLLRALNCHYVQGYYFGRPMPFDQALEMTTRDTALPDQA